MTNTLLNVNRIQIALFRGLSTRLLGDERYIIQFKVFTDRYQMEQLHEILTGSVRISAILNLF